MTENRNSIVFRKPVPEGVVEIRDIGADGGIVELNDGSWMLAQGRQIDDTGSIPLPVSYRISEDGGRTWSDPRPLGADIGIGGMIKLRSGAFAAYVRRPGRNGASAEVCFYKSMDEGKTWSEPTIIAHSGGYLQTDYNNHVPLYHNLIQLSSGRLLYTGYLSFGCWDFDTRANCLHPDIEYDDVMAYGLWRGQRIDIEGHGHGPEMGVSVVYRSDDEGMTWQKHPGVLMGWFDFEGVPNGYCGQTSCFEPTIAETKNGNVLLIMRSTVGRLVQSISTNGGEHWHSVKPTDLASSESPGIMVSLPETGDLLLVWNQVSREEIRRGYRRGRLSSAISKDGGHSWENFKTLELSEGMEDFNHVQPEYPIKMVRARDNIGPLPDGWAYFHYANLDVIGDKVIVRYNRGTPLLGIAEQNLQMQDTVLRVYPVEWFYK